MSRSGKSVLLGYIVIEGLKRNQALFVIDFHGDLILNILKMIPRDLIDKVIVIDFGLNDLTPQITIRANLDITNPSKASDDLTDSMRDVAEQQGEILGASNELCFYELILYLLRYT